MQRFALISFITLITITFFYLTTIPFTLMVQSISAWTLVALLWLLKRTKWSHTLSGRIVFLMIVAYISTRYLLWRTFDTLIYINFVEFIFMALLFIAELEVAMVHFMGMFSNIWPTSNHEMVPLPGDPKLTPHIDIFIPTYNEPEEIVEITVIACKELHYPKDKVHIHVLDDGATQQKRDDPISGSLAWNRYHQLKTFCEEEGVDYIARERNEGAKAGNINYALERTDSEFILFLDCDHVPTADFLSYTVGHFLKDKKLFLVQTPHFFINPDPVEKNLHSFHTAPSENEMFFRATHPGINLWNSSFFCGSAAIMRRSALEEVGGFQGKSITEDAETSLDLHAKGYKSLYIRKPLICGLAPETFGDFITQRSRWCQGMLQIGFLKNPLFKKGLSIPQKLCYSSFYIYWFFGFARVMFFIAPTLFLLFDLRVYHASTVQVAAYALPHLVASLLATDLLFGKFRWPFFSELYESVQSVFLLIPVLNVIGNPRKPQFMVTPKGTHLDHDFLSPLAMPFYIIFLVMLVAMPVGVYRWFEQPYLQDVIVLCGCWLMLNIVLALASLGAFWERHQIRHYHRAWAQGKVEIALDEKSPRYPGVQTDLSLSGVGFHLEGQFEFVKDQQILMFASDSYGNHYTLPLKIKRLQQIKDEYSFGCEFLEQKQHFRQLIAYVYGDSKRWQDFWERPSEHPNIFSILVYFVKMGLNGAVQSFVGINEMIRNQFRKVKKLKS